MAWKIVNLWRQVITKNRVSYEGFLPWGFNNDFPLSWAKTIAESPSGASCQSTVADFIEGSDFSDVELSKRIVNTKGETMWQIHHQTSESFSQYEGFAWLFRFNPLGQITEWETLEFENCRLGKPDDSGYISKIYYNPFFGTSDYKSSGKQTTVYDVWNPAAVKAQIAAQGNDYLGQVFWFGTTKPLSRFYPLHWAFASENSMETEAGVTKYHKKKVKSGFLQPFMLAMIGDPNAPVNNPDSTNERTGEARTAMEEFNDVVANNFMGDESAESIWVQWFSTAEEIPKIVPFPTNATTETFIQLDANLVKKITVSWKVPSVLANINEGVSLGGDANQVRVAVKLMQQRVIKFQRMLTDGYTFVLRAMTQPYTDTVAIVPYDPYPELTSVDDKVWEVMTTEEKRRWVQENTDVELDEEEVITDPNEQAAQMRNAIPVGFPDKVKTTARKAQEYIEKMQIKCGGNGGWQLSKQITEGSPMKYRQLTRIHSYLKKRSQYANEPMNSHCDTILYNAWGGKEMFDYLEIELKKYDQWLN